MKYLYITILIFSSLAAPAIGKENRTNRTVSEGDFDRIISEVITKPEYAWRMPRPKHDKFEANLSIWGAFIQNTGDWIKGIGISVKNTLRPLVKELKRLIKWIKSFFDKAPAEHNNNTTNWQAMIQGLLFLFLTITTSILGILIFRMWKNRNRKKPDTTTHARPSISEILTEEVLANELPLDEWMTMAREFLEQKEYRLAIRTMFLASLVHLSNNNKLTIAKSKSNKEYENELDRRAHDAPSLIDAFKENIKILERIWYGMHETTISMVELFSTNQDMILQTEQKTTDIPPITPPTTASEDNSYAQ